MASENTNTIQITAYTPAGFRVYVNVDLQTANEIDALLQENGYLAHIAGAKAGEDVETITHVSLRMKSNDDGTATPHVAFYVENEGYEFRWVHKYLNNDSDVKEFEAATGLLVSSMPVFPATSHPERKPDKMAYIVKLSQNIKVARKQVDKGLNADGTPNKRNYFERYVTTAGAIQEKPLTHMTKAEWNTKVMELTAPLYSDIETQKTVLTHARDEGEISYQMSPATAADTMRKKLEHIPF